MAPGTCSLVWRSGRKAAPWTLAGVVGVAGAKVVLAEFASHHVYSFSTPLPVVVLGMIIGTTYGLLAVGLVLVYRTNRIINFAHGQIGAFAAAVFALFVLRYHLPYWVGFPIALGAGGAIGSAAETGVVRRLRKAPRLVSIVATLGVGQFLVVFAAAINSSASAGSTFPEPAWLPVFNLGKLRITPAYSGMLILSPLVVLAIALFLRFSRFGLGLRAAAANPEAARMSGIFSARMSGLAWGIAGALSAFSAILTQPTQGFTSGDSFGPELLLRAITAAVIARMESLPAAMAAGIGLGVAEQLLLWNYPNSGLVEVALFVAILLTLLLQRRRVGRDEEKGSWAAVEAMRPLPEALRQIWLVRNLGLITGIGALGLTALLPLLISNSLSVQVAGILAFSIVGLSVGILTGLAGQLTLGQFAVAAIGAVTSYYVSRHTGDFALALLYAGMAGGLVSVLIGLPALRIRGLMLTVTTLSFALATPAWLLGQPWMLGGGVSPRRPTIDGKSLDTGHSYFYFALAVFVICLVIARNVRRSGFGRLLIAIRDNEENARAFTVPAGVVKLQGYLLAGFLAGIGGAVYGHSLASIGIQTFPAAASISVVVMTVIGGVSVLAGPVIGALWVLALPLLPLDSAGLAATQLGGLLLVLFIPRGLVSLLARPRDWIADQIGRAYGVHSDPSDPAGSPATASDAKADASPLEYSNLEASDGNTAVRSGIAAHGGPRVSQDSVAVAGTFRGRTERRPASGGGLLEARHLSKHFGGVAAVQDVSLRVTAGETVGLIGPNGAGKTTTFELLGGFTRADSGRVIFNHTDITHLGPEGRAKLGMIRSFQDAALFPTMTVLEAVKLGLERVQPTQFLASVAGVSRVERRKERRAGELVASLGLGAYRNKQIQELSTGTRRITEIACLVALQPIMLLLDEPSSGIAQRETEALGRLLETLKSQLGLTLLIIEHDIPLVMGISDRIITMADGKIIAAGTPAEVRANPIVIEAYLGGSLMAIERSGSSTSVDEAGPGPRVGAGRTPTGGNKTTRNGAAKSGAAAP